MEFFLDIEYDDALFFAGFLQRLTAEDYRRVFDGDDEAAQKAKVTGQEMLQALRGMGFLTC